MQYNIHEIIDRSSNLKYFMTKSEICLPIKFYGREYTVRIDSSLSQEKINGIFRLFLTFFKERESRNMVIPVLQNGDLFIDVGASYGSWTLPAAAIGADVMVIEPDTKALEFLRHQLDVNGFSNVNLIESIADNDKNSIDRLKPRRVKLIKIDVEGMEFDVLDGARNTIKKYKPNILVELHTFKHGKTPDYEIEVITDIYSGYRSSVYDQKTLGDQEFWHIYHYL